MLLDFYVYFHLIAPAPTVFFSVNSIPTKFSISGKDLKNVTNDKFQCLFQILHKKKWGLVGTTIHDFLTFFPVAKYRNAFYYD